MNIDYIMIHHSLTKDGATVSWPAIEKFHKETQGWNDIGYHAGVELVTDNPELSKYRYQALMGRGIKEQAAACPQADMNRRALHVCCVGNFDLEVPSDELLGVLVHRIIKPWMVMFGVIPVNIVGHREFNLAKSCPGSLFDLDRVRRMVL
jgi:hypothetical protein